MRPEGRVGGELRTSRRYLPHWQAGGSTYFITFRLADPGCQMPSEERRIVKDALLHWHRRKWHVHALTVMPDHVHVLATPLEASPGSWYTLSEILHGVKRWSARGINHLRGRKGQLWQHASYDRLVRNAREFDQKADYIMGNATLRGFASDALGYDGFWNESFEAMEELRERRRRRGDGPA